MNRLFFYTLSIGLLISTPMSVLATDDAAEKKFHEGIDALKKDDFSQALEAFEASYALAPKASVLYNIGMCQKAMFRYTDAKKTLEKFLAEKDRRAKDTHMVDTVSALEEINAVVGKIEISAIPEDPLIRIDGRDAGQGPMAEPMLVNPGMHMVELTKEGFERYSTEVEVGRGKRVRMTAVLSELQGAAVTDIVPPPVYPNVQTVSPHPDDKSRANARDTAMTSLSPVLLYAGISALGLSAAGIASGVIFTLKWNDDYDKTAEFADLCMDNGESSCRVAHTYYSTNVENDKVGIIVGFSVAGALVIAGTSLVVIHQLRHRKKPSALRIGPASITGVF